MFNDFLRQMKDDFIGTRYSAFWDRVVEGMCNNIVAYNLIQLTKCGANKPQNYNSSKLF